MDTIDDILARVLMFNDATAQRAGYTEDPRNADTQEYRDALCQEVLAACKPQIEKRIASMLHV